MIAKIVCSILVIINLSQTNPAAAKVYGKVFDFDKDVIAGASVTLENLSTQMTFYKRTNGEGAFSFESISPGRYRLSINYTGFEKSVKEILVKQGEDQEINIKLDIPRCPDPVIRLSPEEKIKLHICPLHNQEMQLDVVPIGYGLVVSDGKTEKKEFPNAHSLYEGGCVVKCYTNAEVYYCSKCREAEWKIKTQYRITNLASKHPQLFKWRQTIDMDSYVFSVSFSPKGDFFAANEDRIIKLFETKTGLLRRTFHGHSKTINSICFSADGKFLASASDDSTIKIWRVSTGKALRTITVHSVLVTNDSHDYRVFSVAFSPDGREIVSGSGGFDTRVSPPYGEIKLWDTGSGKLLAKFPPQKDYVWTVAFSPDGRKLIAGLENTELEIWNINSKKIERKLIGHTEGVSSVSFSSDGRKIISAGKDHTVRVWNSQTGKELLTLTEHESSVHHVAISTSNMIYSADGKGNVIAWNLKNGSVVSVTQMPEQNLNSMALSADGNYLVGGFGDHKVMLWERR